MPSLSFQSRFAEAVISGQKRQTIRRPRKQPIRPGDTLYLFSGMRARDCRRLGTVRCTGVARIVLTDDGIDVDGKRQSADARSAMARADGFQTFSDMAAWFKPRYGLPFEGVLIRWSVLETVPQTLPLFP